MPTGFTIAVEVVRAGLLRSQGGARRCLICRCGGPNSLSHLAQGAREVTEGSLVILPDAAKLIFRGRSLAVQAVGNAFGVVLPMEACRFASSNQRTAYWLGPDEWMLSGRG